MSEIRAPVLMVGSCPGPDAEGVLRLLARSLTGLVAALPDGERGDRRYWINYLAYRVYDAHPDLESTRRPRGVEGKESWIPAGYDDFWRFRVRPRVTRIEFPTLGYAAQALDSYAVFLRLRDEGLIPGDLRFQVCLPLTESGTRVFMDDQRSFDLVWDGYEDVMRRELRAVVDGIPAQDLLIQWDVAIEVLAAATGDEDGRLLTWATSSDPFDRYRETLGGLSPVVPESVPLGLHLCYGNLYGHHLVEPDDLDLIVQMANAGVRAAGRRVDYVHFPVPLDRHDGAYFAPLAALDVGGTRMYAGLVHDDDGIDGCVRRLEVLRRHYTGPLGVATECGFGGHSRRAVPELLRILREVAAYL